MVTLQDHVDDLDVSSIIQQKKNKQLLEYTDINTLIK